MDDRSDGIGLKPPESSPQPLNIDLMKLVLKVGVVVVLLVFTLAFFTKGDRKCDRWRAAVNAHLSSTGEDYTKTQFQIRRAEERRLYELGVIWNEGVLVSRPEGCNPTLSD